jgi:endonuclease I
MGRAQNKKLTGKFFEPIDEFKGDLARGYFYLLTAYYEISTFLPPNSNSSKFIIINYPSIFFQLI